MQVNDYSIKLYVRINYIYINFRDVDTHIITL